MSENVLTANFLGLFQMRCFRADSFFLGFVGAHKRDLFPNTPTLLTIAGLGLFPTGNTKSFVFHKTYGPN